LVRRKFFGDLKRIRHHHRETYALLLSRVLGGKLTPWCKSICCTHALCPRLRARRGGPSLSAVGREGNRIRAIPKQAGPRNAIVRVALRDELQRTFQTIGLETCSFRM
jgi:hypothetical protein